MSQPEKQRMAPINEIYNRIIWDERLNSNAFIAAYTERMSSDGMREKPLAKELGFFHTQNCFSYMKLVSRSKHFSPDHFKH